MADSPNTPDGFPAGKQNPPPIPSGKKGTRRDQPSGASWVPPNQNPPLPSSPFTVNTHQQEQLPTDELKAFQDALVNLTVATENTAELISSTGGNLTATAQNAGINSSPIIVGTQDADFWDNNKPASQQPGANQGPSPTQWQQTQGQPNNHGLNYTSWFMPTNPPHGPGVLQNWMGPTPSGGQPPGGPVIQNWMGPTPPPPPGGPLLINNMMAPTQRAGNNLKDLAWEGAGLEKYMKESGSKVTMGAMAEGLSGNPQKLIAQVINGFVEGMQNLPGALGKTVASPFGQEKITDAASTSLRGMEETFSSLRGILGQLNPYLIAMEKAAGFAATLFESVETLRKFNDQLIQSNISFAEHSAAMTQVEVSMERFKIEMDQVRGGRRAETAMFHAESVQRLERSFAKWEDAWANLKGGILGEINIYLASILEAINKWMGFKDDNLQGEGVVWDAKQAYEEIDWINQFGRLPANQNAHPRTPRV